MGTWLNKKPVYIAKDGFGSLKQVIMLDWYLFVLLPSLVKHNVINFSYNLVFTNKR
jgi:hypothetical protein